MSAPEEDQDEDFWAEDKSDMEARAPDAPPAARQHDQVVQLTRDHLARLSAQDGASSTADSARRRLTIARLQQRLLAYEKAGRSQGRGGDTLLETIVRRTPKLPR